MGVALLCAGWQTDRRDEAGSNLFAAALITNLDTK